MSCTVCIPNSLTPPSGFGISTLLTGDGLYLASSSLALIVCSVFGYALEVHRFSFHQLHGYLYY